MSTKYSLNLRDVKHIAVHAVMVFLASAPAVVYVHGELDLVAAKGLLISTLLFVGQSTAQRWLRDNSLPEMPESKK